MSLRDWAPKNVFAVMAGIVLGVIVVPVALLVRAIIIVLGIDDRADRTPQEVADYLRKFIDGTEGERDLDDFESVAIKNEHLESIRTEFLSLKHPWRNDERAKLKELLTRTEALAGHEKLS